MSYSCRVLTNVHKYTVNVFTAMVVRAGFTESIVTPVMISDSKYDVFLNFENEETHKTFMTNFASIYFEKYVFNLKNK